MKKLSIIFISILAFVGIVYAGTLTDDGSDLFYDGSVVWTNLSAPILHYFTINFQSNETETSTDNNMIIGNVYYLNSLSSDEELQAYIDRDNRGPKTIYLGKMNLIIDDSILITNASGIKVLGCGIDCTNITVNETSSTMGHSFKMDRSSNLEIADMSFYNIGVWQSGGLRIQEGPAENNYLHDLHIEGYDNNAAGQSLSGIKIGDNTATDYSINTTVIERVISIDNFRGFYLAAGTHHTIMRDIESYNNSKAGIETDAQNGFLSVVRNTLITNHFSKADGQHCILTEGSVGTTIQNSVCIDSGERGYSVVHDVPLYNVTDINILNNYIENPGLEGIYVVDGLSSFTSEHTCIFDVLIEGNTIYRNESGAFSSKDGIKIRPYNGSSCEPQRWKIINNDIYNDGALTVAEAIDLESSGGKRPWNGTISNNYIDNEGYATSTPNPISFVGTGNIGLQSVIEDTDGVHWTCGPSTGTGTWSCS